MVRRFCYISLHSQGSQSGTFAFITSKYDF